MTAWTFVPMVVLHCPWAQAPVQCDEGPMKPGTVQLTVHTVMESWTRCQTGSASAAYVYSICEVFGALARIDGPWPLVLVLRSTKVECTTACGLHLKAVLGPFGALLELKWFGPW